MKSDFPKDLCCLCPRHYLPSPCIISASSLGFDVAPQCHSFTPFLPRSSQPYLDKYWYTLLQTGIWSCTDYLALTRARLGTITPFIQIFLHMDKILPEPALLQAEQSQLSKSLLVGESCSPSIILVALCGACSRTAMPVFQVLLGACKQWMVAKLKVVGSFC